MISVTHQLKPLGKAIEVALHQCPLWNVDETRINVINIPGEARTDKNRNAFMFVRATVDKNGKAGPVVFNYLYWRTNENIDSFLKIIKM